VRRHFDFDFHAGIDQRRHHGGIGRADVADVIAEHRRDSLETLAAVEINPDADNIVEG
jgi:hypothetical protein